MFDYCKNCGKELSCDEVGLHKKLINRGSTEFFCFHCLAEHLQLDESKFPALIERFRNAGCSLF